MAEDILTERSKLAGRAAIVHTDRPVFQRQFPLLRVWTVAAQLDPRSVSNVSAVAVEHTGRRRTDQAQCPVAIQ